MFILKYSLVRFWLKQIVLQVLAIVVFSVPSKGQILGMVTDHDTASVIVFDADTDSVLGAVPIGYGAAIGDCSITADQSLGFATNFGGVVWGINLTTTPPSLALGTNPIPISNAGEDSSLSPDQKFLAVCDGGNPTQPVSVIDIASQAEISTFYLGAACVAVDVCNDGSVLVSTYSPGAVRRLTMDANGSLADTGEILYFGNTTDVSCAPDGSSGVVMTYASLPTEKIHSFTIPGLDLIDTSSLTGIGDSVSGSFNLKGDRFYARNEFVMDVFEYNKDSTPGALSDLPLFSFSVAPIFPLWGMDQLALNPDGTKLYVTEFDALNVYDASDGTLLRQITDEKMVNVTGVCISPTPQTELLVEIDIKPYKTPNSISPERGKIPIAILTSETFDATTVDPLSVEFGPSGAKEIHDRGHIKDVDDDGDLDLVLHFKGTDSGIKCGDVDASLTGTTYDGIGVWGADSLKTVGCR